jgi:hypothetical protein
MKILLSLLLIITLSDLTIAQTTSIPDANFEQALINLGYDSGTPDGTVLTNNIDGITSLYVNGSGISDLTGIEDFTALNILYCHSNSLTALDISQNIVLKELYCFNNQLTTLDVSQNTALTHLYCEDNQLTTLDVTQNTALTHLNCSGTLLTTININQNTALTFFASASCQLTTLDVSQNIALTDLIFYNNQITSIDVSQNTALTYLDFDSNQLTNLDVSQNTALTHLICATNQLTDLDVSHVTTLTFLSTRYNQLNCLNLKNGTNTNITYFNANGNSNLTCIEVDDSTWSSTSWTLIDPQTSFSTNCGNPCSINTEIEESSLSNISLYPNPTTGRATIDLEEIMQDIKATLTNSLGQIILTDNYTATNFINLDINAPKGVYFLNLEVDSEVITKKIIKK